MSRQEQVAEHMSSHVDRSRGLVDALVRGDLDALHSGARDLERALGGEGLPPAAAPLLPPAQAAAADLMKAADLYAAGDALARLGQRCGACHAALSGAPPELAAAAAPPSASGALKAEMARHQQAASLLWLGLALPSPPFLAEGAAILRDTPLAPNGTPLGSPLPAEAAELELRVHDLAGQVGQTMDEDSRVAVVGELLGTCGTCHGLTRGGPAAPSNPG